MGTGRMSPPAPWRGVTTRQTKSILAGFLVDAIVGRTAARHRKHVRDIEPKAREQLARAAWQGDVQTLQDQIERVVEAARDGALITSAHVHAARRNGRRKEQKRKPRPLVLRG